MPRLRVEVDESLCECVGYCSRICSDVFAVDAVRKKSVVLKPVVEGARLIEAVEEAEMTCPARAIILTPVED